MPKEDFIARRAIHRETDRQTDRQADRQTDIQIDGRERMRSYSEEKREIETG